MLSPEEFKTSRSRRIEIRTFVFPGSVSPVLARKRYGFSPTSVPQDSLASPIIPQLHTTTAGGNSSIWAIFRSNILTLSDSAMSLSLIVAIN